MTRQHETLCSEANLAAILEQTATSSEQGMMLIEEAIDQHPEDPRLHFLKGSLLIEAKRFIEAHQALSQALNIAPEFALARFQLGFFELTSGEVEAARTTWEPLNALPKSHWMRAFISGLEHLVADRFAACIAALRHGIAANTENPPLNEDMALIIAQCEELAGEQMSPEETGEAHVSATSILLGSRGY